MHTLCSEKCKYISTVLFSNYIMLAMKTKTFALWTSCLTLFLGLIAAQPLRAQTIINLTQDVTVRSAGAYTYYARGDASGVAVAPFTTAFYPGASLHASSGGTDGSLIDTGANGASVSLSTGYLSDNSASTSVWGWIDVEQVTSGSASTTHNGSFDILFDLGSTYVITSVVVTYTDASGKRWTSTANTQLAFTSLTAPTSDSGLTSFASATTVGSATNGLMTFDGADVEARYVDLRLDMSIGPNPTSGSVGGIVSEVAIYGYAVPEPSTYALLGMGVVCLFIGGSRCRGWKR